ncbi:N-ethylammeline chlorohydrolase [Streptococcus pneumoniae]|nr:N-ethylammeline chlorohydrolase [Streptococcus pneumoniae]
MTQYPFFYFENIYSMRIKEQTRKLAAGCSKHCFEVADGSKHCFEVVDKTDTQNTVLRLW